MLSLMQGFLYGLYCRMLDLMQEFLYDFQDAGQDAGFPLWLEGFWAWRKDFFMISSLLDMMQGFLFAARC
jgi:hypothetical protein